MKFKKERLLIIAPHADDEILGCFHGFHAPVKIDKKTDYFYSLHDLMVDKDHLIAPKY